MIEGINYYFEKGICGKRATDYLLNEISNWMANYLNLAFKIIAVTDIVSLTAITLVRLEGLEPTRSPTRT